MALKQYLTVHGHFYQPPRENPWLEQVELQKSASPFHDWNERVSAECYAPNAISKIVGGGNKVLDIVNNYAYMSFNMGPTLLSWLENHDQYTYERVIQADIDSVREFSGHGNALAQVYNHIIMPLANERDKYTQTLWGIRDFQKRYGRMPEGIWLAETACDDETLGVLADCGIKFTVLSPYQAEKVRAFNEGEFKDVSHGEIDTTKAYRYNIKCRNGKSIDLFFYNAQISQAVAFEELLKDGGRFVEKLKTGISKAEDFSRLTNIATDGESYGHHTKFGDMALAYVLRIKAGDEGFTLTNYGEYLEKHPPVDEVVIKSVSSWSCCHGVGRWKEDCGCSTGGMAGWNQKWRKPLRNALNMLRDKLVDITEIEGKKYFKNVWVARNNYIDVVLDRNNIEKFLKENTLKELSEKENIKALKLMEIQRQAMLMFTSCGWFFNEISGIETVQIMKYAARAIQLAKDFSDEDLEKQFVEILKDAKSNIPIYGNGKDIWNNYVKPSVIDFKQIASVWAITSLYRDYAKKTDLYCFNIKKHHYKKISKGYTNLVTGHIEIKSKVTLEKVDVMFALLQYSGGDFHCAVKKYDGEENYMNTVKNLIQAYQLHPPTETIRLLDEFFGKKYFTLKDVFIEERREILKALLKSETSKFQSVYKEVYEEGKGSVLHLKSLGLDVPVEFKLAAKYTLSQQFNAIFKHKNCFDDETLVQSACDIIKEAEELDVKLHKEETNKFFSEIITNRVSEFVVTLDTEKLDKALEIFEYSNMLELSPDISVAQNMYFSEIYSKYTQLMSRIILSSRDIKSNQHKMLRILQLGEKLNIDTDFYKNTIIKAVSKMSV